MNIAFFESASLKRCKALGFLQKAVFKKSSSRVFVSHSFEALRDSLNKNAIDIILFNLDGQGERGIALFKALKDGLVIPPIIVLVSQDKENLAKQCMQEGAVDYLIHGTYDGFLLAKMIEHALEQRQQKLYEKQLSLQLRIATILAELGPIHNAGRSILKAISEILSIDMGEIWAVDPETEVLRQVLNWSEHAVPRQLVTTNNRAIFKRGEGIPGFIWKQQKTYYTQALAESRFAKEYLSFIRLGFNTCFGFPVTFKEEVLGVVVFYGTKMQVLEPEIVDVFTLIGKQIGSFFKSRRLERDLLYLVKHDLLTGLPNKELINNFLEHALIQAQKQKNIIAIIYVNLDRLSNVNYSLGYEAGDLVLREIAQRLQRITRKTDLVARLGGDEFAIILTDIYFKEHIDLIAKKILTEIERPLVIQGSTAYITASLGIGLYPQDGNSLKDLFIAAGLAMYHSKFSGRNTYQYVSSDWQKQRQKNMIMEASLHQALQKKELFLCYQPVIRIADNTIIAVEALCRWKNAAGEVILPMDFIPIIEQSDLIKSIGEWILETACRDLKLFQKYKLSRVSVNVSANQLTAHLAYFIQYLLGTLSLDAENIILEITESALMDQSTEVIDTITTLNEIGIQLSIDDFGTGYSSFANLKNFKLHCLKIDKSFIAEINKGQNTNAIVKAIILMAHELGMQVIAEGVEEVEQLNFLQSTGCEGYQGFYYSKPLDAEELIQLLKKEKAKQICRIR